MRYYPERFAESTAKSLLENLDSISKKKKSGVKYSHFLDSLSNRVRDIYNVDCILGFSLLRGNCGKPERAFIWFYDDIKTTQEVQYIEQKIDMEKGLPYIDF
ncbi:hypothetical protein P8891_06415 [Bacillus atrophaeus]|uniref:hypothetical protein n=1 Tax=Bacillus atrophaeus TaxID=1452 RepID=UPI002280AD68|nr:hypothetical protein [Bacillus atrophaeus]MCY7947986.1 hypothetical protein [Bacillus atrophaeus]MCY8098068.1 hypothetical protein [Bacillus atrophaeus]MCY9169992.1 hypothetical protein [Bacillus atrophaeus]MEC0740718.1 hypothetical protein [Bacillus atrophaeus]MEC0747019.1 hypothetical protein [Bacillus atrophaeus]